MKKCMLMFTPIFICIALNASDDSYALFCAIRTMKQEAAAAVATADAQKTKATVKLSDFPSVLDVQTKDGLILDISNKIEVVSPFGTIPLATDFIGDYPQALKKIVQSNLLSIVKVDARKNPPNPQVPTQYKIIAVAGCKLPTAPNFDFAHKTDAKKNMELWMALDKRYKKEHSTAKL